MAQYKAVRMRTTAGNVYTLMRKSGRELVSLTYPKYYKTKMGANRAIQKRVRLGI
jgi:hypothetical protein